ncbi:MAG: hypothetical protein IT336_17390 [Thermomicrobiales bacterium]|nr:hypothetical protein [Thermomicrobiales bacterium]
MRVLGAAHMLYDRIGIHMPPKLRLDWATAQYTGRALLGDDRFGSACPSELDLSLELAMTEAFAFGRALRDGTAG